MTLFSDPQPGPKRPPCPIPNVPRRRGGAPQSPQQPTQLGGHFAPRPAPRPACNPGPASALIKLPGAVRATTPTSTAPSFCMEVCCTSHTLVPLRIIAGVPKPAKGSLQERCVRCGKHTSWVCSECTSGSTSLVPVCPEVAKGLLRAVVSTQARPPRTLASRYTLRNALGSSLGRSSSPNAHGSVMGSSVV